MISYSSSSVNKLNNDFPNILIGLPSDNLARLKYSPNTVIEL